MKSANFLVNLPKSICWGYHELPAQAYDIRGKLGEELDKILPGALVLQSDQTENHWVEAVTSARETLKLALAKGYRMGVDVPDSSNSALKKSIRHVPSRRGWRHQRSRSHNPMNYNGINWCPKGLARSAVMQTATSGIRQKPTAFLPLKTKRGRYQQINRVTLTLITCSVISASKPPAAQVVITRERAAGRWWTPLKPALKPRRAVNPSALPAGCNF